MQLNLFAGSLYLNSFADYTQLCDALGLLRTVATADQSVSADGFITSQPGEWQLKASPVPFLRQLLLKIGREGEGVEKTHLGRILNGLRLEEKDFKAAGSNSTEMRAVTPERAASLSSTLRRAGPFSGPRPRHRHRQSIRSSVKTGREKDD